MPLVTDVSMIHIYFVTGTDTGVGKTTVAVALLKAAARQGLTTAAIKPVAAGCEVTAQGLRNDDALQLQQACTFAVDYQDINPVALEPAIAPHFAAQAVGLELRAERLVDDCRAVLELAADFTVIEGAGGWRVPLNDQQSFADIAIGLDIPVILVVDIKLGCLNHALLSAEVIRGDGQRLAGWVANQAGAKDACHDLMVADLRTRLACPLLGDLSHIDSIDGEELALAINIDSLLASEG